MISFGVAARTNSRQTLAVKFNKFVWDIYAQSARGKKAIKRFSQLTSEFIDSDYRICSFECSAEMKERYGRSDIEVDIPKLVRDAVSDAKFKDLKAASQHYRKVLVPKGIPFEMADQTGAKEVVGEFPGTKSWWYDYVAAISLGLYQGQPNHFLPYNFRTKFNQVEEIHAEFNIPLPRVPGKSDKSARCLYYADINEMWQEFRQQQNLSPVEMCAFLYDFAPQFTTPLDSTDLPDPSKVWLIPGESGDIEFADEATSDTVSRWGGNPAIRRGDILMLYLVSPRKAIDSIWRACTDGYVDPFFHYHCMVWICGQIKTAPVSFSEIYTDPLLSQKPAVRGRFWGPSGKASFTVEEYEAILAIMKSKGQDISVLPRILASDYLPSVELQTERDVEKYLIEPFLKRLGFKGDGVDWIRQMPVKMGRGERNYPDYAFGAIPKRGEESAKMILESKFQLSAQSEFKEAFYQTKSYALRLQAKIMAMAAKEGVWVFPPDNGNFDIKKFVHKGWGELNHPDHFHDILQLIGRDKVWA